MLRIFAALTTLAESILGLAGSVNTLSATLTEANGNVRKNLALDAPPPPPALTAPAADSDEEKGDSAIPKKGRAKAAA